MSASIHFTIPPDHPALPGHFPGRPIVPAAMLLDEVLAPFVAGYPVRLAWAKFIAPVLPGHCVEIAWSEAPDGGWDFTCRVEGREVVRGRLAAAPR